MNLYRIEQIRDLTNSVDLWRVSDQNGAISDCDSVTEAAECVKRCQYNDQRATSVFG